jgi:hypothetical protein
LTVYFKFFIGKERDTDLAGPEDIGGLEISVDQSLLHTIIILIHKKNVFRIRSRESLGLSDPDPIIICTDTDPAINKQKNEENLDFFCFVTFWRFFIFEE